MLLCSYKHCCSHPHIVNSRIKDKGKRQERDCSSFVSDNCSSLGQHLGSKELLAEANSSLEPRNCGSEVLE